MYDDALNFYKAVLPPSGVYYLALIKSGRPAIHKPFTSIESMVTALDKLDADPNYDVYHACASYLQETVDVDGKTAWRHITNRDSAKAFWIDVDCGASKAAKGDGYPTKKEAFAAVKDFCTDIGLPQPAVVDSGNGLHFYWPLTKAIKDTKWIPVAQAFKAVLAHHGVLADPTRTADFVSILRTPGTTNKKDPNNHKAVVLKRMVDPIDPAVFWAVIKEQVSKYQLISKQVPSKTTDDVNDELASHAYTPVDCSAVQAAEECAQMAAMRDTQGDVGYEHWFGVIGVIKHCVEGEELALEWSSRREETGHSQTNTEYKFETWNSGPTTCAKFEACNPEGCKGCAHKGKITSPIQLGKVIPIGKAEVMEVQVGDEVVKYDIPALPDGFKFDNGTMFRVQEREGVPVVSNFCTELFYLTQHIRDSDGTYRLNVRHHHSRNGKVNDFQIAAEETAAERELVKALIRNSVLPLPTKEAGVSIHAYVRASFERLKREADEVHTYEKFGWQENYSAFLIGDRMYCADGSKKKVLLSSFAADCAGDFPEPTGTLEGYTEPFNFVYSRPGMEPLQYFICSAFGAALTPFAEQLYHGLICAATGGDSGKGKTTAAYATLYAWGDADRMTVATKDGATLNARFRKLGVYSNIPALFDEMTNQTSEEVSTLAYATSMGKEKERLTANPSGVRKAAQATWDTCVLATANRDLHATLAEGQANSQAEAVRMLQINVDNYAIPAFKEGEVDVYLQQMARNHGVASEVFIKYLVTHVDELPHRIAGWVGRVAEVIPGQKFRFFRAHVGCTMAAAEIMAELGICRFNLGSLFLFVCSLMESLSRTVNEQNTLTPKTAFSQMLNEFGPRIITTQGYRDTRDARGPELIKSLNQDPIGRWIQGSKSAENSLGGRVYISKKHIREWCMKNRVEMNQILGWADDKGLVLHEKDDRFTLGRGTPLLTGNTRCVCLDFEKYQAMTHNPTSKPELKAVSKSVQKDVSKSGTDDL
jgi:Domain of unknown function (DUF927)